MVKRNSELQRTSIKLIDAIKNKQKELEEITRIKVSFPQASEAFFAEFQDLKSKFTKKGECKF